MKVCIHRGATEIGGSCVEISQDGCSLLLDLGLPLTPGGPEIDVGSLKPDAVLVSHPHMDHYGLIESLDPSLPVWMSPLAEKLINSTRPFLKKTRIRNLIRHFESWKPFRIGPFEVTPYLMDHSSPDSNGFLVEAGGKRLFYSGDLRGHGRKGKLFSNFLKNPPKDIDTLLLEGTMIGRSLGAFPSEESVELKIAQELRQKDRLVFLVTSSQNIDRLVSAYRACLKSGRTLVVDPYTAWVLESMKAVSSSIPAIGWEGLRVCVPHGQYLSMLGDMELKSFIPKVFGNARIWPKDIVASPGDYLWVAKMSWAKRIQNISAICPVTLIYSQWLGYLQQPEEQSFGATAMKALKERDGVSFVYAHTSGHAPREALVSFARAVNAKRIVPIHTNNRENFKDLLENVTEADDGVPFLA